MVLYRFVIFPLASTRLSHALFSRVGRPTFSWTDVESTSNHGAN
jgi:hypothetical protein